MNDRQKYPRTLHLPWSEGVQSDDKMMPSADCFVDRTVVVTEKMDGENTTMYCDYIHARSIDGRHHPSRDWVKQFHYERAYQIPYGFRICGENMYARHSIQYEELETFFYGFSVWDDEMCLSWDDTMEWFKRLDIIPTPVLYRGEYDVNLLKEMWVDIDKEVCEGYVIRVADSFNISEFGNVVGKAVRKGHVQTDDHWMHGEMFVNRVKY